MAERTIVVCDVCGKPASERVTLKIGGRSLQKDLCDAHLAELVADARPAKRGRRPALGTSTAAKPAHRSTRKAVAKRPTRTRQAKKAQREVGGAAKR